MCIIYRLKKLNCIHIMLFHLFIPNEFVKWLHPTVKRKKNKKRKRNGKELSLLACC